jgi:hypothetical protein
MRGGVAQRQWTTDPVQLAWRDHPIDLRHIEVLLVQPHRQVAAPATLGLKVMAVVDAKGAAGAGAGESAETAHHIGLGVAQPQHTTQAVEGNAVVQPQLGHLLDALGDVV